MGKAPGHGKATGEDGPLLPKLRETYVYHETT